jgi:hypothetical protein
MRMLPSAACVAVVVVTAWVLSNGSCTDPELCLECPHAPGSPFDTRSNKSRLTLATWNLEWFFDGVGDPSYATADMDPAVKVCSVGGAPASCDSPSP